MNKIFERRMTSAQSIWFGQVKKINAQIGRTKSFKRRQSLRKSVVDSAMRYTVLYNKISDWALQLMQSGQEVPNISAKINPARQKQLLDALLDATWLKDLQIFDEQTNHLQDVGDDYNAQWLQDHDLRWAIEALNRVHRAIDLAKAKQVAEKTHA
jgi:hypothetical protein